MTVQEMTRDELLQEVEVLRGRISALAPADDVQRQTVAALRQQQAHFAYVLETVADAVLICGQDRRILFANASAERLLCLSRQEILRRTYDDPAWRATKVDGSPIADEEAAITRSLRAGQVVYGAERLLTLSDGTQRYISINSAPMRDAGDAIYAAVVSQTDITARKRAEMDLRQAHDGLERKVGERTAELVELNRQLADEVAERRRAEELLRQSETRYRLLFENDLAGILLTTPSGNIVDCNPACARLLGYTVPDEVRARQSLEFYADPEDRRKMLRNLRERGSLTDHEVRVRQRSGAVVWVLESITVTRNRQGQEILHGTLVDITERKRAEEELRRSQEWLAAILGASRDGVFVEAAERVVYANDAAARLHGYGSPAELVGLPIGAFQLSEDSHRMLEYGGRRLRGEAAPVIYPFRGRRRDGTSIDLEASVSTCQVGDEHYIINVFRDIGDRIHLEAQLRQAQKMESVGRLAGGIAHDFNNLLTIITSYTDLLLRNLGTDEVAQGQLAEVKKAAYRAAGLVQQLLAFSRKQVLRPRELDLNAVVANMRDMLRPIVGEHIELVTDLTPDIRRVHADANQIEQAILNLVTNARDAMPRGGRLIIQTRDADLSLDYALAHPGVQSGRYVLLAVTDTGCGMTEETIARLFEPFFTTKEVGKGTGLGLASVFGIVEQSGGHIEVESKLGLGSTFRILLPESLPRALSPRERSECFGTY